MSEREPGIGAFVLGIGVGVVLGILFAPAGGEAVRAKLAGRLRGLRELAADKAGELGALMLEAATEGDRPPRRSPRRERLEREDDPAG
jgi:gas vesicle protein